MASRYVSSFRGLPGWHHDQAIYKAWNAGDIAHHLDNKPIEANPFDMTTQGLLWRTWRRGWEGFSLSPIFAVPPPLQGPPRPIKPIITSYLRLRMFWLKVKRVINLFRC